jgi:predicted O-linked N-acetylglucosamine transferase (SPINDLY family)
MVVPLSELAEQAMQLHEEGRLAQAEALYRQVLSTDPDHFEAQHLLGMLCLQQGRTEEALALVTAALDARPDDPHTLSTYGAILNKLRRYEEAVAIYDKALIAWPDFTDALVNRGIALKDLKRFDEAFANYDKALAISPAYTPALINKGVLLSELQRLEEALECYDKALALQPHSAAALSNRANTLLKLKRVVEALETYDRALAVDPNNPLALYNRGNALYEIGQLRDAVASFDKALALEPNYAAAFNSRGLVLKELKRFDESEASYKRALELRPTFAEALFNLGGLYEEFNRRTDAIQCYEKVLALKPNSLLARLALCMAELPILYASEAEIAVRRTAYLRRLEQLRDDLEIGRCDDYEGIGSRQPFYLAYQGENDREPQRVYGSLLCRCMQKRYPPVASAGSGRNSKRLRIGFVSGHFNSHTVWKLMLRGWISQLNRCRFEVIGYYTGGVADAETRAAADYCDRFVRGPLSIDDWRRKILADSPDALIYPEVGMDHASVSLAAQRLANVQCNSWGHPETSGFPTLDYFLSSDLMEPPHGEDHYTEKLVRLPNLSIYYEPPAIPPLVMSRAELGLRPSAVAFWCGQSLFKYLPQFDQVFPRIAREISSCQFLFIEHQGAKRITDLFRKRLDDAFSAYGLDAAEYCVILPRLDMQRFLAAIEQCDVILDSIGWSGGNTTLEGLGHSLPIVTLPCDTMRSRHTSGILSMLDVTETIASTMEEYVALAARLAQDASWRVSVMRRMSANKERIYRDMTAIHALEDFLENAVMHRGRIK